MKSPTSALIIEKSPTFSKYLALLLQRMGLKSLHVFELEDAKSYLSLVFTDILIVGDQCVDKPIHAVVQELANHTSDRPIPIIVISTCADSDVVEACGKAGCQSYLLKPVQPKKLHDALYAKVTPASVQRKNLRSNVELAAEVIIDGQQMQSLQVLTLSKRGMLVSHSTAVSVGTKVSCMIPLDGSQLSVSGRVIYNLSQVEGNDLQAFCIHFELMSSFRAEQIDLYLERILDQRYLTPELAERVESSCNLQRADHTRGL